MFHSGSQITLDDRLEASVDFLDKVNIFNKPRPHDWFGGEVTLKRGINYFFIRGMSKAGLEGLVIKRYPIVYDPDPPEVVKQSPLAGYTSNTNPMISIVVRESLDSSQVDPASIILILNGIPLPLANISGITKTSDNRYNYYNITYLSPTPLNGTYFVNFTGTDFALNQFIATESASPSWIFTVNEDSPIKPRFIVDGGIFYNNVWYVKESPVFSLEFFDPGPVDILNYYRNFIGNYVNVPACKGTADSNLFTGCVFEPPLKSRVVGSIIDDEHQIIVNAKKVFTDLTAGPPADIFLEKVVIDNITPEIEYIDFPKKIRENSEVIIETVVLNEAHDLNATLFFNESWHDLTQVSQQGSNYFFKWKTPQLDFSNPAIKEKYEGFHNITIRIADYAGNFDIWYNRTYLDLSNPNIDGIFVFVRPTRVLDPGLVTNQTEILITGNFTDDDIESIYIKPGDYIPATGKFENISELANIIEHDFELTMIINGTFNITTLNMFTLFMEDDAGYASSVPLSVVADLEPPFVVDSRII
ncbi:hypothetical protein ACFL96_19450 [Thermoproteota archaeon]